MTALFARETLAVNGRRRPSLMPTHSLASCPLASVIPTGNDRRRCVAVSVMAVCRKLAALPSDADLTSAFAVVSVHDFAEADGRVLIQDITRQLGRIADNQTLGMVIPVVKATHFLLGCSDYWQHLGYVRISSSPTHGSV
jgi:hypothetical protein